MAKAPKETPSLTLADDDDSQGDPIAAPVQDDDTTEQPDAEPEAPPLSPIEQMVQEVEAAHASVLSTLPEDFDDNRADLVNDPNPTHAQRIRTRQAKGRQAQRRMMHALKAKEAFDYRMRGYSYEQIAEAVGYRTVGGAHYAVSAFIRGRQDRMALTGDVMEQMKQIDAERLDMLLSAVSAAAMAGDLYAVKSAQDIIAQKARLLGYEAPAKVATTNANGEDIDPQAWDKAWATAAQRAADRRAQGVRLPSPDDQEDSAAGVRGEEQERIPAVASRRSGREAGAVDGGTLDVRQGSPRGRVVGGAAPDRRKRAGQPADGGEKLPRKR